MRRYKLLTRDEIAPRRAAVMAYTCNLLLHTLPAIERELHPPQDKQGQVLILDIDSAVAPEPPRQRAAEAQRLQDATTESPK